MRNLVMKGSMFLHLLFLACVFVFIPHDVKAEKHFQDIGSADSHYEAINYLNQLDVYDYKTDDKFHPNQSISRKEAAKILHTLFHDHLHGIRDYSGDPFKDAAPSDPYYDSILWAYEAGIFDGDGGRFRGEEPLYRAQLAKILVNTFDLQYSGWIRLFQDVPKGHWAYDYIYTLYGLGITTGSNGYFMPEQYVTNGQFASFLYRTILVADYDKILAAGKIPERKQASGKVLASYNSEYEFVWHQIGRNEQLELEGVNENNEVVGFYSTVKGKELFEITIGKSDKNQVLKQYGKGIEAILKNNLWYKLLKDEGYSMYFIEGKYVTFFFDLYNRDTVRSILWVEREYEKKKEGYYGDNRGEDRREGFENLMVELMNQARAAEGIPPLISAQQYRETARKHSLDMVRNHFVSHIGSDGKSALERMLLDGMNFVQGGGENIAAGAYNTIYAHEALMNSLEHRENILYGRFTHAFTGVAFDGTTPYWTIDFYFENK